LHIKLVSHCSPNVVLTLSLNAGQQRATPELQNRGLKHTISRMLAMKRKVEVVIES